MSSTALGNSIENYRKIYDQICRSRNAKLREIRICCGTGCQARGALKMYEALQKEAAKRPDLNLKVKKTGCQGLCEMGTLITDTEQDYFYCTAKPEYASAIIERVNDNDKAVESLLYLDKNTGKVVMNSRDIPFYHKQQRLVLDASGTIDPEDIRDYIATGGYKTLARTLAEISPEQIIEKICDSGLRGRGGGGFPTGKKWLSCYKATGKRKRLICNADEGDPGAFMDRSVLEGNPHSVLEGMIIGAYALGAEHGYIYVRDEYPLAVHHLRNAIRQAEEFGLLGSDILGTGFKFNIQTNRGGGSFVCGESSALIASLQGEVGEPQTKYIHTVESGLWKCPTVLNNVETWATIPIIIRMGVKAYSAIGSTSSKGTKIFSVVGKVNNTGLVEVPMGITIREVVYDICGGIRGDGELKAVQTGGPSGGCIPASLVHLPIDFDSLKEAGSMMGSGGLIVMDEKTCMVDLARYFTDFLRKESCGKCTLCREGTERIFEILTRICAGEGKMEDLDLIAEMGEAMNIGSLCALGTSASNPVLSTLRHFREEYVEHIQEKKCRAGVCPALVVYTINSELCRGCGKCKKSCPVSAIKGDKKQVHEIDSEVCVGCGACLESCPFVAVERN